MTEASDPTPTADADKEHPFVGRVLSERYRIDSLIGEGGMGAVFRATHLSLERTVAIKLLHPALTNDESVGKRFEREALAASKLDHPGCVQVLDFGTSREGMKYLVMQFLEGRELRALTDSPLPLEQAVDFGAQILRALEHAHKRGLVHRDLKPENIFLVIDDEGTTVVKLVDFGIVKLLEVAGQEKLTRLGMAFGTPAYMSPEQAAGGAIDTRTDLYAVGILLYEMLTGALPFDADEPGILLRMHILEDPPPLPPSVPAAVSRIVLRLLDKDPDDRFQSAREARVALVEAGAGDAGAAPGEASPELQSPPAPDIKARAPVELDEQEVESAGEGLFGSDTDADADADADSAPASSRTEKVVPVRSGRTVVADSSTPSGAAPPSSVPSEVASSGVEVSMSGGTLPSASTSQGGYGSVTSGIGYDPLAVSSAHVPKLAGSDGAPARAAVASTPGGSGAASRGAPATRAGSRRAVVILLVILGMLLAWGLIAAWWMSNAEPALDPSARVSAPESASP